MCRILGYLGPDIALDELLFSPAHSLCHQARRPRLQDAGRINGDGWGVGWYDLGIRSEPARYRTEKPIWADRRFSDATALIRSKCFLAAVRNASPGAPIEEAGNSPFTSGRYLFTHNGYVDGFRDGLGVRLRRGLSDRRESSIWGSADSEVLFAMVLDSLDEGSTMTEAVADVIVRLRDLTTGKFNILLSDGRTIVAARDGNTLFSRTSNGAQIVASEPFDDDDGWEELPDCTLSKFAVDADPTKVPL